MTHQKKLLSTASILAIALTLSACGSNSNDTSEAPTDPVETPADPYKTATDLTALSSDDPQEAGSALMKATEAAEKITLLGSNGDSNAAMMSAQAVLDARTELEDAKSSAEKVLEDLPDTPENAAERDMLETAITAAEDLLDGDLKAEIVKVTGTDEEEPETPEDKGAAVAKKVLAAFDSANGVVIGRAAPRSLDASDDQSAVTGMTSSGGKTFREIFNSDVTDYALGAEGALVPTISIAGEDFEPTGVTEGDKFAQGANPLMGMAHGIEGSFHCVGAGCEFKEGKLVGSWVFTPSEATSHYVAMEGGDVYTEVRQVWYGHWLDESPDGSMDRIRASARLASADKTSTRINNWGTIAGEDASATYSGNAAGRSVRHEFATDGEVAATHSGSFTADVDLTATFGADPMLEGKVSGFSAVDNAKAVNTGWEVTLEETAVIGSILGTGFNNGVAKGKGSDEDGAWIADSYLDEGSDLDRRPDGIYGTFDADFTDGQAAGAFATRKNN